ncbi:UDP-N-acetylgalactosamine-undecaprenyl-phosphate N-acetylgalactosaminephosphotransferase [Novipirellula galeiformis]|uniref:UDP-N-acetylgalactosamine-undecaprenyl-phosphate N-acetylgalactosaminephosphotransferase n=1 Tax=Novipirellula galeiformis TaxID=2528004 RepID=A0A5C6CK29_9BACT|nr:sugar transferase [Novipirellula galeiformis]TWU23947.1 UDP-N-acetylgalactosamine-undecaprenyl-phosphate N-acetylgalactosaminephosphotransferase [Novipirellula galeiformis]
MTRSNPVNYDFFFTTGMTSVEGIDFYQHAKRALDFLIAGTALFFSWPLFLLVALAIKWEDGGNVFYWSQRVGRGGRCFECLKFRSMVVNAEMQKNDIRKLNKHADERTFKLQHDPRITWLGRWIRRYSIDELPQFWNVLRGDMSVVGPRPTLPEEVDRYSPLDYSRFDVLPGLTCIWQVSGRGDVPFDQQIMMDLEYIRRRSFWLDITLIFRTIPVVISGKGAY